MPSAETEPRPLTVGTAGHIDHGKTELVRALTGRDTDRLAEEKRRGISIELGFAQLALGERRLSLIDVPGHERFVRTMIAGASGIDLFLMVVAADDGVMPQTIEHLTVLRALGVEHGVVAVTKCDAVDGASRALAAEDCAARLPGLEVVQVSARTGDGLDRLRQALSSAAAACDVAAPGPDGQGPLLHVDRAFTVPGHGTVVTGTLWSGVIERGQSVLLLPGELEARVRSIEVHDRRVDAALPRQRVALNLGGIGLASVGRGDVITVRGAEAQATYRLDADIGSCAGEAIHSRRVQVHLGTREAPARVVDLGEGAVQLRLEQPLIAREGDRVVVRKIAPPHTLGGGPVLDPQPPRRGRDRRLAELSSPASPETAAPGSPQTAIPAPARTSAPAPVERTSERVEPSRLALRLLARLRSDGLRPSGREQLAEAEGVQRRDIERALQELVAHGDVVRLKPDIHYPARHYDRIRHAVLRHAARNGSTTIGEVRDMLGVSRKYAQAILEQLDGEKALRRDGDRHIPRRESGGELPRQMQDA